MIDIHSASDLPYTARIEQNLCQMFENGVRSSIYYVSMSQRHILHSYLSYLQKTFEIINYEFNKDILPTLIIPTGMYKIHITMMRKEGVMTGGLEIVVNMT